MRVVPLLALIGVALAAGLYYANLVNTRTGKALHSFYKGSGVQQPRTVADAERRRRSAGVRLHGACDVAAATHGAPGGWAPWSIVPLLSAP